VASRSLDVPIAGPAVQSDAVSLQGGSDATHPSGGSCAEGPQALDIGENCPDACQWSRALARFDVASTVPAGSVIDHPVDARVPWARVRVEVERRADTPSGPEFADLVQSWLDGGSNLGLLFKDDEPSNVCNDFVTIRPAW